jgi:hypothetical protein
VPDDLQDLGHPGGVPSWAEPAHDRANEIEIVSRVNRPAQVA